MTCPHETKLGGPVPCPKCGMSTRPGMECRLCNDPKLKEQPKHVGYDTWAEEQGMKIYGLHPGLLGWKNVPGVWRELDNYCPDCNDLSVYEVDCTKCSRVY